MNIYALDLNLLSVFEALITEKSVSKAAKKIGLSQPAASAALNRLRHIYKDPLFVRTQKEMVPTAKAITLQEPLLKAFSLIGTSLIEKGPFNPADCNRIFRVAMSDWTCLGFLPELIRILRKKAPHSKLVIRNMTAHDMQEALNENALDLAITGQNFLHPGSPQQILYKEYYKCIAWKNHFAFKKKMTIDTFVSYPHLLFSPTGEGSGDVDKVLAKIGKKRNVVVRVAYSLAIPALIQNTDFICTVPRPVADFFAKKGDLKTFDPPMPLAGHNMTQYWNKKNNTDPAHVWFRGLFANISRELA